MLMSKSVKLLKYLFLFLLIGILTGCATARQNPYQKKRAKASRVHTSQLGRNKYYFSTGYQKKLLRSYKKK
jgi:hypothetical protein